MSNQAPRDTPWTRDAVRATIDAQRANPDRGVNLLEDQDLSGLDLSGLDFSNLWLSNSRFVGANLSGAKFYSVLASTTDFTNANLSGADLSYSILDYAKFTGANLSGASVLNAIMSSTVLDWATAPNRPVTLPEGEFMAYKKVHDVRYNHVVLALRIPDGAGRVAPWVSPKCRASEAFVVRAFNRGGDVGNGPFYSAYNRVFKYAVGERVVPNKYNPDPRTACTSGIHFFTTPMEAHDYLV